MYKYNTKEGILNSMSKGKTEKIEIRVTPIVVCIFISIMGILLIVLAYFDFKKPPLWWDAWGANTSNSIGTTLIASSIVSIVLEFSNMKNFVKNVLKNILGDDFPLEAYSKDNLEQFQYKLASALCNKENVKVSEDNLKNSIYSTYENKLRNSSVDIYYDYHNSKYSIIPDENNGLFKVKAEVVYNVINKYGKDNRIKFKAKTYKISNDGEEKLDDFIVKVLEINDKPVEINEGCIKREEIPPRDNFNYYNYKIKIDKSLGDKKSNKIKMVFEYNIPIYDNLQSYKVSLPCKRIEHRFRIYDDCTTGAKWRLQATAFAAYYNKQGNDDARFKVEQNENDLVKINFEEWVFPGSGYVVTFSKL